MSVRTCIRDKMSPRSKTTNVQFAISLLLLLFLTINTNYSITCTQVTSPPTASLLIARSGQKNDSPPPASIYTKPSQQLQSNKEQQPATGLQYANDSTGGVDEILRDTFQLLDSLDHKLAQVNNRTRSHESMRELRKLDDDLQLAVGPNKQHNSLLAATTSQQLKDNDHDDVGELTQLAVNFSSERKSSLIDTLIASSSSNSDTTHHQVPTPVAVAISDHHKRSRQLDQHDDDQQQQQQQPNLRMLSSSSMTGSAAGLPGKFDNDFTEKHIRFTLDMMRALMMASGQKQYQHQHQTNQKQVSPLLESFLISPVSIQLVLMMMHLGARGHTKRELSNTLHFLTPSNGAISNQTSQLVDSTLMNSSNSSSSQHKNAKLTRRQQPLKPATNSRIPSIGQQQQQQLQQNSNTNNNNINNNVHEQFGNALRQLLKDSTVARALSSANQIFLQKDLPLAPAYEWAVRHYYGAELKQVDFQNQTDAQIVTTNNNNGTNNNNNNLQLSINDWIERQTRGKIANFLSSPVPSSTLLMALNVLFYKGDWQYKFDPADTDPESYFTQTDGSTVKVPMMVNKLPLAHAYDPILKTSVIELPYKAQRLGLFILLPDEVDGIFTLMHQLNSSSFANLISMMRKPPTGTGVSGQGNNQQQQQQATADIGINVRLPKFSIESSPRIGQLLSQQLGLKSLFSAGSADLSGMFAAPLKSRTGSGNNTHSTGETSQAPPPQVGLDEFLHKAVLQVHEAGSVAAAASATIVERVGLFNGQYFEADHPFLLFLMDKQTGLVLFSGAFAGPSSSSNDSSTSSSSSGQQQQSSSSTATPPKV